MRAPRVAMVADDDPGVRALLHHVLRRRGFVVVEAINGSDAVTRANSLIPDLVFLDLRMPGTDGWSAVETLRANPLTRRVPVVAMSALNYEESRARLEEAGFVYFLPKPFELSRAEALIEECLQILNQRDPARNAPPTP